MGFSLTASVAARETEYGSTVDELTGLASGQDTLRSAREVRIELIAPSLEKIYNSPKWLGGEKVKHVIEARARYDFVDGIDDFNRIIRFDETDVMSDTNQVTLSIANRLFVKDKSGNVNEVLSWEVAQSRYFDPTFGGAVIPGQRNVVAGTLGSGRLCVSGRASQLFTGRFDSAFSAPRGPGMDAWIMIHC